MNEAKLFEFISMLAHETAPVIRESFFDPNLVVEKKTDASPVTRADRKAEEIMRHLIHESFPEDGIIGEEFGNEREDARFTWVLDPIDGTKAFAAGCPLFGTLIALLEEGRPILGAINNPVTGQMLLGNNRRTTLNGNPVKLRRTRTLEEATLLASNLSYPAKYRDGKKWNLLLRKVRELYTWGDCYGYLLIASGGADIMADPIMNPWDLMSLIPIIRGAGGVITDWMGNDPVKGDSIIAANPYLHPQVIETLNA